MARARIAIAGALLAVICVECALAVVTPALASDGGLRRRLQALQKPLRFGVPVPEFDTEACIDSPAEFVAAFLRRDNRCVDPGILVRLQSDNGRGGAPAARDLLATRLKARPVTFFSYGETPGKYLRTGTPIDLGNFNEVPAAGGDADATFDGLEFVSNFLAMLEQIGYDTPSSFITGTYAMVVLRRPAAELHNSFIPTWHNVVSYFSSYLAWVADDPSFQLSPQIVDELSNKTFGQLTGCPASCTFEDLEFPGPKSPRPAVYGKRSSPTSCLNPNSTRFVLTEPTGFDDGDASCSQLWQEARAFSWTWCTNGNSGPVIKAYGAQLVAKLKTLSSVAEQAMYFRAYLSTGCGGGFNTLFSGNGFTYTGTAGLMSPTGAEILVGAAPHLNMDNDIALLGELQFVYFCSDGTFSQDPTFKCKTSS